ncbi:MAG: hypothetical protein RIR85_1082, partial [Pseudomonadota bacterium]
DFLFELGAEISKLANSIDQAEKSLNARSWHGRSWQISWSIALKVFSDGVWMEGGAFAMRCLIASRPR